jgi:hypothetical protein
MGGNGTETLFSQVQRLFERTYSGAGVNLELCLIGAERCRALTSLAGPEAAELHPAARTFLRRSREDLHVAIYYSPTLIEHLEREDPRRVLSDSNIHALIMFVEEINHALHAALCFLRGQRQVEGEDFARNLELQGQVDTYLLLLFFAGGLRGLRRVPEPDRAWIRERLFGPRTGSAYRSAILRQRYGETREQARRFADFLDTLAPLERLAELRAFHHLDYGGKLARIADLPAATALPASGQAGPEAETDRP